MEPLEERALLNAAWGDNGPPLVINTAVKARTIALGAGDAAGKAGIGRSEIDYYRFTPQATGFYRLIARGKFDIIAGIYHGGTGDLLGYSDRNFSGNERFTAYLEAGQTYCFGISNYRRSAGGGYRWRIDDVDVAVSLSAPITGSAGGSTDGSTFGPSTHKLYLNFDGALLRGSDLRAWDDDWEYGTAAELDPRGDGVTVSPLLAHRGDRETIIDRIIDHVQDDLAPFGVQVVRLPAGSSAVAGVGFTTVFVGPSTLEDRGIDSPRRELFHVAGDIDAGNNNRTDVAFVSDEDWGSAANTALALADVVLHEAGHTFGLFHVHSGSHGETMGLRYSIDQSSAWVRDTGLLNRSFYFSEERGSQNSFQVVAAAFGAGGTLSPLTIAASTTTLAWRAEERLLYTGPVRHHHDHDLDLAVATPPLAIALELPGQQEKPRRPRPLLTSELTSKSSAAGKWAQRPQQRVQPGPRPREVSDAFAHTPRDHVFASLGLGHWAPWLTAPGLPPALQHS